MEPATTRSTRRASSPPMRSRSDALELRISLCSGSSSSRVIVNWFSDDGSSSRRAAAICARHSSVPLLPTASFGA